MQILTARPQEEPTWGPEVYIVDHDNPAANIGDDYDVALKQAKDANPNDWQCTEVIEELEKMGWRVILTNPVHKEY